MADSVGGYNRSRIPFPHDVPAMVHADRRPMLQIESLFMP